MAARPTASSRFACPRRLAQHSSSRCEVKVGVPRSFITEASPESCPQLSASGAKSVPLRQLPASVAGLRQKLLRTVKAVLEILERKLIRHGRRLMSNHVYHVKEVLKWLQ